MGGGVTLLAALTFFYPMRVIVPLHGCVQFISNASRTSMLKRHVRKDVFVFFLCGAPFGAGLAYFLLKGIADLQWGLYLVVGLLLYTALKPRQLPDIKLSNKGFLILGLVASLLGPMIGATGPLLAPFFVRDDFSKEEIVATKAACQLMIHLLKFPIFLSLSFAYHEYVAEIGAMFLGVILGTRVGIYLLERISLKRFQGLLKGALFLTAVRLIYKILA